MRKSERYTVFVDLKIRKVPVVQPFVVVVEALPQGAAEWMVSGEVVGYGTFLINWCDDCRGRPELRAIESAAQRTVDKYAKRYLRNAGEVV